MKNIALLLIASCVMLCLLLMYFDYAGEVICNVAMQHVSLSNRSLRAYPLNAGRSVDPEPDVTAGHRIKTKRRLVINSDNGCRRVAIIQGNVAVHSIGRGQTDGRSP